MISDVLYVVGGLLIGLAFQGGLFLFAIPFALISLVLGWLNRPSLPVNSDASATGNLPVLRTQRTTDSTAIGKILRTVQDHTGPILVARDTFGAFPEDGNSALEKLKGNEIWIKLEEDLDPIYRATLQSLRQLIPNAHSVVLFLKSGDGRAFVIRQYASRAGDAIDASAKIPDASGFIGLLALRDRLRILEGDLANGLGLGYYKVAVPIRSVAGVPLFNGKRDRIGALVVDSMERNAFGPDIIPVLDSFASMFYMLTFKSYTSAANFREKKKFYELSAYQQKFFRTPLLGDTYKEIFDYVSKNFIADRIMILVYDRPEKEGGTVAFCRGEDEKKLEGMHFSFSDKGILPLSMMQHFAMERLFDEKNYVYRLNEQEPRNSMLRYLFVQPSSMTLNNEPSKASEIAICLERRSQEKFDQLEKDLLRFMVNIAYFAYQRGRQYEHEQFKIYHDALTGLLNRRTIDERITELNKVHQKMDVGVMMMDIDHFKHINDTYGHQAGDAVLKGIAGRIQSAVDFEGSLLARYGGEEFFVALPGATNEVLKEVAEKIRTTICSAPFDIQQREPIPVSVSVGCFFADRNFHGQMSRAVKYADEALYSAKETGRNKVVQYENRSFGEEVPAEKEG